MKTTGDIYLAWSDEAWVINGADVRISIVGFDNGSEVVRHLDSAQVLVINSDLTSQDADVSTARVLRENLRIGFNGIEKGGPFELSTSQAQSFLNLPQNVNGRSNSEVIKRWRNGIDIVRRSLDQWIIDFDDRPLEASAEYEAPFEYVRQVV